MAPDGDATRLIRPTGQRGNTRHGAGWRRYASYPAYRPTGKYAACRRMATLRILSGLRPFYYLGYEAVGLISAAPSGTGYGIIAPASR
ncbi:hypothetical protein E2R62_08635 [Citrobacter rodentium]|uniref:Uncharacterized protein n=1 Tax=Citrobacter rodentium TaxID=67825 RepID=A0A482PMJ3_CITRO|nr:hypothetical protein E2R62_08635 [Citrobacter rodentium]